MLLLLCVVWRVPLDGGPSEFGIAAGLDFNIAFFYL
jgi:hypothetical protein